MVEDDVTENNAEDNVTADAKDENVEKIESKTKESKEKAIEKETVEDRKKRALELLEQGMRVKAVAEETGLTHPVVRGMKGGIVTRMKKQEEEKKKMEEEAKGKEIKQPVTPYEEVELPDEFLRKFLTEFEFNEKFIDLVCRRVKRRNALPYPNDLARDIRTMESGIKNPNSADYIADEYSYDFKDYLKRLESTNNPRSSMGHEISARGSHNSDYGGLPMRDPRLESYGGISLRDRDEDDSMMRGYRRANDERGRGRKETDDDQVLTMKDFMMWQVQEENRRLKAGDGKNNPDTEQTWMRERMEKMEDALRQNDADRMQRLEDELKVARNTPPPQVPNGPSSEEVRQIVEREIDARTKKLTADDVERIVQNAMGDVRSVTKEEFVYREARDKYHLEEKKLDEGGKTRDVIGKALSDGFSHAGNIIGRWMTGEGETTGTHVEGYSNQPGNLMQVACPGCNAVITAPIGSSRVVCPGCGKVWDVEPRGHEKIPPKEEKKSQAEEFTPEQKKVIDKSLKDAKEGRIEPLETSEPTTDAKKIAEDIAIGEATKKLEEELKKKKVLEEELRQQEENERKRESALKKVEETVKELPVKKKKPHRPTKICPVCKKKLNSRHGVASHIAQVHPDYKRRDHDDKGPT